MSNLHKLQVSCFRAYSNWPKNQCLTTCAWWLATCSQKPKVYGSSPVTIYEQLSSHDIHDSQDSRGIGRIFLILITITIIISNSSASKSLRHLPVDYCRQLLPTNCLSVFDHFVGLALKGLRL